MDYDHELRDFKKVCRLFPLPGVVLFPHAVLPLHIFEPRYRQMTDDALAGDRLITMVQALPRADPCDPSSPPIAEVGCLGKILIHERLADGRYNFLLLGCRRVRLIREITMARPKTLYRQAEVELLEDIEPEDAPEITRSELIARFHALIGSGMTLDPDLGALLASDAPLGALTDLVAHALGLPPDVKQGFLDDCRVDRRAAGLIAIMRQMASDPAPTPDRRAFPPPFSAN